MASVTLTAILNYNLTNQGRQVLEETIDYIVSFINGNKNDREIRVPNKFDLKTQHGVKMLSYLIIGQVLWNLSRLFYHSQVNC